MGIYKFIRSVPTIASNTSTAGATNQLSTCTLINLDEEVGEGHFFFRHDQASLLSL